MAYATLIHSPSGGSASDEDLERARALLSTSFELEVVRVSESASPPELARAALASGSRLLIASGGDGTVSGVGGALVGHPGAMLGILPRGTANSIATHLGVPRDIDAACAVILAGHTRIIDTARVNDSPMLLMATLGVHAEAVTLVDPERKKMFGALAYVLEELDRILDAELFEVTVESNGERASCMANAVTVANIARVATVLAQGPAIIEPDDGALDVTLVAIEGFAEALATTFHLATTALMQRPAERDNVGHFRTTEVRIETREPKRVMVDGEDATSTPITVKCFPKSLTVLVPMLDA
ncbi:MAG: lipid kinase [Myxococcaceae bacterium]|nr:lipid kinase [Myxococcaceae bacterium]